MFKQVLSTVDMEGGIYKITNVNNNKVYIGRATNFLTRWRQHAKCGTGADNGAKVNLRLYEAMMAEGVENFTFEVIDPCAAEDQPAREKYWVEFYHSIEYGYNDKGGG
jgi:group I intron endonuclease